MYRFTDITGRYWPIADILESVYTFSDYVLILELFSKTGKNAWTSNLKWCNYLVCPAESSPLCNLYQVK